MSRTAGENAVPVVVACVAYSLYKEEKRAWIVERQIEFGRKVRSEEVAAYVTTCNDLRVESWFTQAREVIADFSDSLFSSVKDDLNDQIYRQQFESLHDLAQSNTGAITSQIASLTTHVSSRTRPSWIAGTTQGMLANFFWTMILIVLLVSVNVGFDYSNFKGRVKAFLNPPSEENVQPKASQ
jgi:hypothetical protein